MKRRTFLSLLPCILVPKLPAITELRRIDVKLPVVHPNDIKGIPEPTPTFLDEFCTRDARVNKAILRVFGPPSIGRTDPMHFPNP